MAYWRCHSQLQASLINSRQLLRRKRPLAHWAVAATNRSGRSWAQSPAEGMAGALGEQLPYGADKTGAVHRHSRFAFGEVLAHAVAVETNWDGTSVDRALKHLQNFK